MVSRTTSLLITVILLLFMQLTFNVNGSEIYLIKEMGGNYSLVVTNVSGEGVGGFYAKISVAGKYTPSDINVSSNTFLIAYNILNSTLVIAGAQGKIPGPLGNVVLSKISIRNGNITLKPVEIEVSDVNGNTIAYYNMKTASNEISSTPTKTLTPVNTITHTYVQNKSFTATITQGRTTIATNTPNVSMYQKTVTTYTPITTTNQLVKKEQENVEKATTTATPTKEKSEHVGSIPGFTSLMLLIILSTIAIIIKNRKG